MGGPEPPRPAGASAGLPLDSMRVVEACSVAVARGAAFVSPHCIPRITEVHSAAACASPVQSPSDALLGYDDTALFHHAAYAASYTARSAMWQATPLATPGAVSTRQRMGMLDGGFPGAGKKIQECDLLRLQRHNYEHYVILYYIVWAHLSGTQQPCTRLP